ncbi:MAG: hypothetical protein K2M19_04675 [Muribaculaceae bacterium]|nr:hypothetical protein [Muribaculaceae bacterium]
MKHLFLLFLVILSAIPSLRADANSYDPIVTPGRTWWYHYNGMYRDTDYEFGYTIGEHEEIEGETWYHIERSYVGAYHNKNEYIERKYKNEGRTDFPFWIREKDGIVEVRNVVEGSHFEYIALSWTMFADNQLENGDAYTYTVYKFGQPGDHYFYGDGKSHYEFEISEVNEVETPAGPRKEYGNKRVDFVASQVDFPVDDWYEKGFRYIEGIGQVITESDYNYFLSNLFFMPMSHKISASGTINYMLRYVTDEDYNILYEGKGGIKLWETDPSGVESVTADQTTSEAEYYTLQGDRVNKTDLNPGIYISRQGAKTSKIIIR